MATNCRHFTAPNDEVVVSDTAYEFTACTVAAIGRIDDLTNLKVIIGAGTTFGWTFYVQTDESIRFYDTSASRGSNVSRVTTGNWYLMAFTKSAGTVTGRFHIYNYTTPGWVHENAIDGTTINAATVDAPGAWLGQDNASAGNGWNGELQVIGFWNSTELSDAQIETLITGQPAWEALSPTALWPLNQFTTGTAVADTIGAADQSALTGTTVEAGLAAWNDNAELGPQVINQTGGQDAANATTRNASYGAGAVGDLLIAFVGMDGITDITWPAGWTEIKDLDDAAQVVLAVAWSEATSASSGTVAIGSASEGGGYRVLRIQNWGGKPPEVSTGATGSSTNPNPDAVTQSWGADSATLFIACAANDGNVAITAAPSGYNGFGNNRWANTAGAGVATAWLNSASSPVDPGTFTMASEQWVAATVAVRAPQVPDPVMRPIR